MIWMKSMTALLFGCAFTLAGQAETPPSTADLYACSKIENDAERLSCYDTTVQSLEAWEAAGEITTISRSEVNELQKDSFGFSLPTLARSVIPKFGEDENSEIQTVEFAVSSVRKSPLGKLIITLENGQVWEQTGSKQVNFSQKRGAESAEIKRAALGSFKMKLDGGRSFRAKRTK